MRRVAREGMVGAKWARPLPKRPLRISSAWVVVERLKTLGLLRPWFLAGARSMYIKGRPMGAF